MKKSVLPLLIILLLVLAGCVNTKSSVGNEEGSQASKETIELLGMSSSEDDLNIVRDQLVKSGFKVKLNIQPDYGSYTAQKDAGNYDIVLSSWTTVTGNPDYAVRGLFKTGADNSIMSDKQIDQLIDKAATETPDEYIQTYQELEKRLVFDKAYIAPLYNSLKAQGVNKGVINEKTVRLAKSRAVAWESIDFNDSSKRNKDPLITQQALASLTSLDPIKGNDGSINTLNTNMYVRLVNLTDDDKVTSKGSLSWNHAAAKDKTHYYFLLRDDIRFAKVENKKAIDSGERVGADDVVFSLNRAKDKNAVPDHRTYSLHEHIQSAEVVTDLSELKATSGNGGTIKEDLEKDVQQKVKKLVKDKEDADNQAGAYQVVKITTTEPFPQVLNYLAHQSAGIVSKKQVERINTYDVDSFDPSKDIPYGDQNTVTEGKKYNNELFASGPYILSYKNDYEAVFYKNPAYMKGTENEPNISQVTVRFIENPDSALSALRNGEIHIFNGIPETKYDVVEKDSKLALQKNQSNAVAYLLFNTSKREVAKSEDLRKAILYSINQEEFVNFYQGHKNKASSTVSPLVETKNELKPDAEKVKGYLKTYQKSKK
ncbi:ABC transporter substrate-binding protein [Bacillus safensis]|uniref:ABC transporter substrate-binding protein n=1 Tax=Bacillus safensis TaxID=561879 RepID=UPI002280717D|nr:ABC transporter substrate-binding protein [Bacillus safensis]MCY7676740.1 ABC transporter substrate-binding protein [Bacillus safensis]MCY7700113.1 ABC transporter substrate-binding protein [Bacillus safensis]MEC3627505.1 ABC transporter substrate-binding protein [Bacillus safensis]